ncbi:GIY-YIG nuclease family protein [Catenovulum sp. SM1970]|uniref:GIY-YIG nuclease family protein n=1 Tax=Marinifaba aquimaris TaxID=2741323 RepID=UPI001572E8A8|nr:GIY-YIG nuclease family protein [Marinifaba aquimaris]
MSDWSVYLITTTKNTLYCGITTDVTRRFEQHKSGKGAKYFRSNPAVEVVFQQSGFNRSEASQLEYRIKQLPRSKKLALIRGQFALSSLINK